MNECHQIYALGTWGPLMEVLQMPVGLKSSLPSPTFTDESSLGIIQNTKLQQARRKNSTIIITDKIRIKKRDPGRIGLPN